MATGAKMTVTLKELLKFIPLLMDSGKVCAECEDNSLCNECFFSQKNIEGFKSELFTDVIEKGNLQEQFCASRLKERTKPKKKKPKLCKPCEDKVKEYNKRQGNKQQEQSKEWKPEDGPFFEE